ncbi:MAG TPA: hypothetical protein VHD90_27025 [Phototrophicaceae bacterium]|nr:hypothetical protein [Phototrophicaceae bacterium]
MRRLIALTLIALLTCSSIAAQQALNYQIRGIGYQIISGQVVVDFTVNNSGEAISVDETASIFDESGTLLASQTVNPLGAGESVRLSLPIPLSKFPLGSSQTLYAVVGLNQLPPANQRYQFGNVGQVTVPIPSSVSATAPTPSPSSVTLPGGIAFNWSDPMQRAEVVGAVAVIAVLLWVLTVIARSLFSRPPTIPAWQPPYVVSPMIDPNSNAGRRQLWQQHAQSDMLPTPCTPGAYMVRKLLIGSNGVKLSGWRVTGLRISQYDRYGRIARGTVVLPTSTVKALDKAARKSPSLDWEKAQRAVRPAAKSLTSALIKKTTKQNAILPIALEIRFNGQHGEVGILFELYGCSGGGWQQIDHWEPEMQIVSGSIYENFTYTLTGQNPQEKGSQFRQRLQTDLTYLLAAMVQAPPPPPPSEDTSEVVPPAPTLSQDTSPIR